jgi:hypothetical protein
MAKKREKVRQLEASMKKLMAKKVLQHHCTLVASMKKLMAKKLEKVRQHRLVEKGNDRQHRLVEKKVKWDVRGILVDNNHGKFLWSSFDGEEKEYGFVESFLFVSNTKHRCSLKS